MAIAATGARTQVPAVAALIGFFVSYSAALYVGYVGSVLCVEALRRVGMVPMLGAIVGVSLAVGLMTGVLQSVLLFRGFGVGRLWAAGTAIGGAFGAAAYLAGTLYGDRLELLRELPEVVPAAMGGIIGLGQVISSGRVRLAPHVLVCAAAMALWFVVLPKLHRPAGPLFGISGIDPDWVLAVIPSALSGAIGAVSLWLLLRWDAAAAAQGRGVPGRSGG